MAGARGRSDTPVIKALKDEPWRFDLVQAVRLLETAALRTDRHGDRRRMPVGGDHARALDAVRFRGVDTLAFPAAALPRLVEREDGAMEMTVALLGLAGPLGVLPLHYTELLQQCRRARNPALADFLDIFNHRLLSLFARAAGKYRLTLNAERAARGGGPDPVTAVLESLVGVLGLPLPEESGLRPATLVHYAGHLSQRRASAAALRAVLAGDTGLPVRIEQFEGAWLIIPPAEHSRLGMAFCTLGMDVLVGERTWDVQGRFRVVLGPLGYATFAAFLPDGVRLRRLLELTRFQVGPVPGISVQLLLKREEVPECRLADDGAYRPMLGWNTWLRGEGLPERDAEDAVFG